MIVTERGGLRLLVFPGLSALEGAGFVCALSTVPLDVRTAEGKRRLAEACGLSASRVASPRQVHGADVVVCDGGRLPDPFEADALITKAPDLPLLLRAADCSLVIVADPVHRAVGVAHAGWRGSARGVVLNLVNAMTARYGTRPEECRAAVGPTISAARYPVGPEVPATFLRARSWAKGYVALKRGRLHLDLPGINARFLREAGLREEAVERTTLCTYEASDLLHSFRRDGVAAGHHGVIAAWRSS